MYSEAYFQMVLKIFLIFVYDHPKLRELVSATAKPLGSEFLHSRRVFSAKASPRQKLKIKICQELSGNGLSEHVFKNSVNFL
jgi:hypothetical protein